MENSTTGPSEATSTWASSGTQLSSDQNTLNTYSTLEVVRPSGLEAYKTASETGFVPPWQTKDDPYPKSAPVLSDHGSTAPISPYPQQPSYAMICGLPKRVFWIIFTVVTSLCVIAIIVGGAVGGTRKQNSNSAATSSIPTAFVTVTVVPTSHPTISTTIPPAKTTSVCVGGIGAGNYAGLCDFACSYGYCPPGPCTCTTSGTPVPTPPTNGVKGVPLPDEDESYLGLCSYCCDHGYCPASACTTSAA